MDAVTVSLFVVLEATLLLAAVLVVLNRKHQRLRRQLAALTPQQESAPVFASVASGYLPYLEQEILDTRARLQECGLETASDGGVVEPLASRLSLLEREKKLAELCNDYPGRRWEHVRACFAPLVEQPSVLEPEPDVAGDENGDLARARKRIRSLEKFREHFFAVKKQLKELEETRQKLMERLDRLLPVAQRSEELQALLGELTEQKLRLQQDLDALESDSEGAGAGTNSDLYPQDASTRHIDTLQEALGGQATSIQALQHLLLQAREQPDDHLIEQMDQQIRQLERQCREANTCVEILEQENERLQHRVDRAALRTEWVKADGSENAAELQQQLDKQKRTATQLHEQIESLKLEAEEALVLRDRVEQLERAEREMSMCVETLEEENEFLQEQIRALLQLDETQTVYQADDAASGTPPQDELEALREEVRVRDETLKALEEKYAAMEQEYLTLYEEANS